MRKRISCLVWIIIALANAIMAQEGFSVQVGELYYWIQEIGPSVTMEGGPYAMVTYHDEHSETEPENSYEGLTVVNIPETITVEGVVYPVKYVEWRAFINCSSLTSVTIGNNVTNIAEQAFYGCSNLTSVTIGNSVTIIEEQAFYGCSGLTFIEIPNSVTSIGSEAFYGCSNLPVIDNIRYADTYLVEAVDKTLSTYTIKEGTKWIGDGAFSYCTGLTSVTIPNSVTSIGDGAFYGCTSLTSVTIPNSVTSIGKLSFWDCSSLTSVTIPNSVTSIGVEAFLSCDNLKTVTIGEGITSIGRGAFGYPNLERVNILAHTPPVILDGNNPFYSYDYYQIKVYVPLFCQNAYKNANYWRNMNIQANVDEKDIMTSATGCIIHFGPSELIASCGIEGSETFDGNIIEFIGLEPNSEHNYSVVLTSNTGETETVNVSFTTTALELITQPSKPVSSTTAILLANTNMADIETSCGFEWKRNDAPADMDGTKAYCPVANGTMAGRLKGLNGNTYYKYRAFYQSSAGNMYYGDWQYIFTGDNIVEFEPILYTYEAVSVKENEATLKGYALAGSDDFTEQGFEYWAESRVQQEGRMARRVSAALGEHKTITASGISMKATLTGLDAGTVYKYRTYAKLGNQTIYGSEMSFTTKGEYTGSEDINNIPCTPVVSSRKILRNGQIFILRGNKTYTLQGQEVK